MSSTFKIKAPSGTDIWRKPPSTDVFTAPRAPPPSSSSSSSSPAAAAAQPLSTFRSARLSFLLHPVEQYDQAGLLLSFHIRGATHPFSAPSPPKWIKTGIEYYNGVPKAATVACDAWADWSLAPISSGDGWTTVLVETSEDNLGKSLWVYQLVGEEKVPLREVCWPFGGVLTGGDEWNVSVEAYACRPAEGKGELEVEFRDFEVNWA